MFATDYCFDKSWQTYEKKFKNKAASTTFLMRENVSQNVLQIEAGSVHLLLFVACGQLG